MSTTTTTITWHPASAPPDDDTTVLLHLPAHSEPVWLGYILDGTWRNVDGWPITYAEVKHWAHIPEGPAA